jgi:hypothetical protein
MFQSLGSPPCGMPIERMADKFDFNDDPMRQLLVDHGQVCFPDLLFRSERSV